MESPRYEEFTAMAPWARTVTWAAIAFGVWAVLRQGPGGGVTPGLIASGMLAVGLLLEVVLGGLRVRLHADRVEVSFGRAGWIRKRVPYREIVAIEPVTYRPLRDFGGWGIRGFGPRQAWTARGNRALVLYLVDGSVVYIGSQDPERLAERMRWAAGQRWDPPAPAG